MNSNFYAIVGIILLFPFSVLMKSISDSYKDTNPPQGGKESEK